jgi:hypothetical protein
MCPACLTTVALVAAGVGSASGLTAFLLGRRRNDRSDSTDQSNAAASGAADHFLGPTQSIGENRHEH